MSNTGFSVHVYDPIVQSGGGFVKTIPDVSNYGHTITATVGFESAEITFPALVSDVKEWYDRGLMRDIKVFDDGGILIFNGFVNSMSIRYAVRTIEYGPATDIANRVAVVYTPIYTGSVTQPPVKGGQTVTAVANNTASQTRFGIFYRLVNAGDCTDAQALDIRDAYLADMAYPQKNETLDVNGTGEISISLKISGYASLLSLTPYTNTSPASVTYSAFIPLLLAADPNTYFSTSTDKIQTNAGSMSRYQDGTKNILDIIKGICGLGDASDNRWTFGIYENRIAYYAVVPSVAEYSYKLSEGIRSLDRYPDSIELKPWAIRPAKWLKYLDFGIRERFLSPTNIRSDPQTVFIESVSFRAPFSLTINGGRVNSVSQKIARLGLGSR